MRLLRLCLIHSVEPVREIVAYRVLCLQRRGAQKGKSHISHHGFDKPGSQLLDSKRAFFEVLHYSMNRIVKSKRINTIVCGEPAD